MSGPINFKSWQVALSFIIIKIFSAQIFITTFGVETEQQAIPCICGSKSNFNFGTPYSVSYYMHKHWCVWNSSQFDSFREVDTWLTSVTASKVDRYLMMEWGFQTCVRGEEIPSLWGSEFYEMTVLMDCVRWLCPTDSPRFTELKVYVVNSDSSYTVFE
jgi:hypothetical protein